MRGGSLKDPDELYMHLCFHFMCAISFVIYFVASHPSWFQAVRTPCVLPIENRIYWRKYSQLLFSGCIWIIFEIMVLPTIAFALYLFVSSGCFIFLLGALSSRGRPPLTSSRPNACILWCQFDLLPLCIISLAKTHLFIQSLTSNIRKYTLRQLFHAARTYLS